MQRRNRKVEAAWQQAKVTDKGLSLLGRVDWKKKTWGGVIRRYRLFQQPAGAAASG
jgi:hypothetical protein